MGEANHQLFPVFEVNSSFRTFVIAVVAGATRCSARFGLGLLLFCQNYGNQWNTNPFAKRKLSNDMMHQLSKETKVQLKNPTFFFDIIPFHPSLFRLPWWWKEVSVSKPGCPFRLKVLRLWCVSIRFMRRDAYGWRRGCKPERWTLTRKSTKKNQQVQKIVSASRIFVWVLF